MNRVLIAARLHLVHPAIIVGIPWLVVGVSFALNLAIWSTIGIAEEAPDSFTGGLLALYFTVLAVYVQAVTQLMPFAMGVSLSRRTFFLGTALVAVVQSLLYGAAITVLSAIERGTDGWGTGLRFWSPLPGGSVDPVLHTLVSASFLLAFAFVGVGLGAVSKRWGPTGIWGLIVGTLVVVGGLAALVSWLRAWDDLGAWFADQSMNTLTIGLPLAVAAVLAALTFAGIRRVVP